MLFKPSHKVKVHAVYMTNARARHLDNRIGFIKKVNNRSVSNGCIMEWYQVVFQDGKRPYTAEVFYSDLIPAS